MKIWGDAPRLRGEASILYYIGGMRVALCSPPLPCEKGVPLLSQNRQFQWFRNPAYIYPVVPASAATLLRSRGHEVLWLDGIARGWLAASVGREAAAPPWIYTRRR